MRIFKNTILGIAVTALAIGFASCNKDDDNNSGTLPPTGATYKTTVVGTIVNDQGQVMPGVQVKMGSYTTVSNQRGQFLFTNADVPKERIVFKATATGYFDCVFGARTQKNEANYIRLFMQALPAPVNISGVSGGMVSIAGGATIDFPANAFVDQSGNPYTGQVKVYARHLNPAADGFESRIPGGDLLGVDAQGNAKSLYSLGMIDAVLKDNSGINEVKLAAGKTAELKFPIDPSQASVAQTTIPMWHLDPVSAKWKQEGTATKSGSFYTGAVSHFSTWNCDYQGERTTITGKVVDCSGAPLASAVVTINNFMNVLTDNAGEYSTWVPAGFQIDCQVLQQYNPSIPANSNLVTFTAVAGTVNVVPTLVVGCLTRIAGTAKTCAGVASPAYVYVTFNGGALIQFTADGNYNMVVPPNSELLVTTSLNGSSGNKTVTSGAASTVTPVPAILMCSQVSQTVNRFTINSNGTSTAYILSNIQSSSFFVDGNFDGIFEYATVYISGTANPGNLPCTVYLEVHQNGSFEFPLQMGSQNQVAIAMDTTGIVWSYESGYVNTNFTENKLVFTDFGVPGGAASGTYEFDAQNGKITDASFFIIRDN